MCIAACTKSAPPSPAANFRGYWCAVVNDDTLGNFRYNVRLDFPDTTVSSGGYEHALGVMRISEDRDLYKSVTANLITNYTLIGPYDAYIQYLKTRTGELWSAHIAIDPATRALTFKKGELLGRPQAPDSVACRLRLPRHPGGFTFEYQNPKPNFKEVPPMYLVERMPDRIYYKYIVADEAMAPPYGELQLRCYYPDTDRDVPLLDATGDSPLGADCNAIITDCWRLPDEPGIAVVIWRATDDRQQLTLYRTDADNVLERIVQVTGRRPSLSDQDAMRPDSADVALLYRSKGVVKVYNPATRTHSRYTLSGSLLK